MGSDTFNERSSLRLRCTVQRIQALNVVWLKLNQDQIEVVLNTTRISISSNDISTNTLISTLHITSAEPSDQGLYVCEATGKDGDVSAVANHNLTIDGRINRNIIVLKYIASEHCFTRFCRVL